MNALAVFLTFIMMIGVCNAENDADPNDLLNTMQAGRRMSNQMMQSRV